MAFWCGTLTAALVLLAIVFGLIIGYSAATRKHKPTFLALAEYWVYLPGETMPNQDELMTLMVRDNPYHRGGVSPIGQSEGLVFSDVRLHMALVLRSKNTHIFRPDQFAEHIPHDDKLLESLMAAKSLVKIRYASEIPLSNKRHLQFLLHAADATAELGHGEVIFDLKAEQLLSRSRLRQMLKENFNATGYDLHTEVLWKQSIEVGHVESRGLVKIGIEELQSGDVDIDQRVITTHLMEEAVQTIWNSNSLPDMLEFSQFEDTFRLEFERIKDKMTIVRILRVQSA